MALGMEKWILKTFLCVTFIWTKHKTWESASLGRWQKWRSWLWLGSIDHSQILKQNFTTVTVQQRYSLRAWRRRRNSKSHVFVRIYNLPEVYLWKWDNWWNFQSNYIPQHFINLKWWESSSYCSNLKNGYYKIINCGSCSQKYCLLTYRK